MRRCGTIDAGLVPLVLYIFVVSCALPTISSSGIGRDTEKIHSFQTGSVLTQYGDHAYVLSFDGGTDTTVSRVEIDSLSLHGVNGDSRSSRISLPEYRVGAMVFAAGNKLYVLGGYDMSGLPRSDIFYTYIHTRDGPLGYGDPAKWMRNPRPLPRGITVAAWLVHDGTVYLFGGTSIGGDEDLVLRARMYADGQLGYWYISDFRLSSPKRGAAAELWDRHGEMIVLVAGGTSNGHPVTGIDGFVRGANGTITSAIPSVGLLPARPAVHPGSGVVPRNTPIRVVSPPAT